MDSNRISTSICFHIFVLRLLSERCRFCCFCSTISRNGRSAPKRSLFFISVTWEVRMSLHYTRRSLPHGTGAGYSGDSTSLSSAVLRWAYTRGFRPVRLKRDCTPIRLSTLVLCAGRRLDGGGGRRHTNCGIWYAGIMSFFFCAAAGGRS